MGTLYGTAFLYRERPRIEGIQFNITTFFFFRAGHYWYPKHIPQANPRGQAQDSHSGSYKCRVSKFTVLSECHLKFCTLGTSLASPRLSPAKGHNREFQYPWWIPAFLCVSMFSTREVCLACMSGRPELHIQCLTTHKAGNEAKSSWNHHAKFIE